MDRAAVRETKRGLFGLNLPNLGILNSGADVDQITTTITSARMNPTGRYLLVLADGATWLQIENVGMSPPKPGDAITIRRAAMGSHLAKIKNGPAFRARRVVN